MKKHRAIDISETQLEDLVRQAPELIEAGLEFVDHQAFTDRGPLDVLMIDSGHSLVVAELKVVEDDAMLSQGIDYYDYMVRNLDGFARAYKQHKIDSKQEPRLFLIAPSFSVTVLSRIKWLDIPVSLFTYQCIQFEEWKDEIIPVYKEVTAPGLPRRVEAYSVADRYAYITDPRLRGMAQELVALIQSWDAEKVLVEAIKYAISIKHSGRVIAYVEPRRKSFVLSTYDSEGKWTSQNIGNKADLDQFVPIVRACFERVRGSNK